MVLVHCWIVFMLSLLNDVIELANPYHHFVSQCPDSSVQGG